jgi:RNA polymerase sigma-70 factor, ECF subfamily
MNYANLDDQALMQHIAAKKPEALSVLYDRYGRLVFSVAVRIVGSAATAEEITLDIFHRAWERAEQYRDKRGSVSTWLASMARNRAIDILRREKVRVDQYAVHWADVVFEPAANTPHPEVSTSLRLQKQRIRHAVAQLPAAQKNVLIHAYFYGMSHREISETLDVPLGTVKTRLRLAMQKLAQLLKEERIVE